jgi:protein O-mannosyl-transferase
MAYPEITYKDFQKLEEANKRSSPPEWLAPAIVATLTFLTFLPVLWNDFAVFDDRFLLNDPHWNGLGWAQLTWPFITLFQGHYRPLVWLTYNVDFLIWGFDPIGYHLTNIILHSANAALFYIITRRLLAVAAKVSTPLLSLATTFAALFFSLHPMRVECVSSVTGRKDLLAAMFILLSVYSYLRARTAASLGFMLLSLLSKATAVMLPAVLVLMDIYLLRCFEWRKTLLEKIPFVLLAIPFAVLAFVARTEHFTVENYHAGWRMAQVFYTPGYFFWRTFFLYDVPTSFNPSSIHRPITWLVLALTVALSVSFWLLRKRWPAPWFAWLYMVAILAPVLGALQPGQALVADRYSYASCMAWAVVAGGILVRFLRIPARTRSERRRHDRQPVSKRAVLAATVGVAALALLANEQIKIWRDPEVLWAHLMLMDPDSADAHLMLRKQGNFVAAAVYRRVLRALPDHARTHNNLGFLLAERGDAKAAEVEFQTAARLDPKYATAFSNIAVLHQRRGEPEKAVESYQQALKLNPNDAIVHAGLAKILSRQGEAKEAEAHFKKAIELNPNLPLCVLNNCIP